ncbi:energy transducer TonB [Dyella telluris]|uniref:Energy transducer TonB n=1 Tax=Dyella telluris TaxID=2763498 RepID=A0A7G8Q2W2_9GAMM|nr:energy transducer TonB [Dyella telluris]QNK01120.1 energy transducer TonB [Dyella telluris]
MNSKLIMLAACTAALILGQSALAATGAQDAPAPASSAASHGGGTQADTPASVDDDRPQPAPRYSATMKNDGGTGTVVVMVQVGADGKAKSYHVMMSSGAKSLDDEAVRTVKKWSYKPAIKNGVPTDGYVQVPVTFNK